MKSSNSPKAGFFYWLPFIALGTSAAFVHSCKKKTQKLTPSCNGGTATYNTNVKSIIDAQCVSCHSGYSSYSGLSGVLNSGSFKQHVLTNQDMPQNGQLTQDQINTIQCWSDAGFPQ